MECNELISRRIFFISAWKLAILGKETLEKECLYLLEAGYLGKGTRLFTRIAQT